MRTDRLAVLLLIGLAAAACGKKGSIYPPLRLVPRPVEDFRATQRGEFIVLEWTNPSSYIDGTPLADIAAVEIWTAEAVAAFPATARLLTALAGKDLAGLKAPAAESKTGQLVYSFKPERNGKPEGLHVYALRVRDVRKDRLSEFSAAAAVTFVIVPLAPTNLRAGVFGDRIELRWGPPAANVDGSTPARLKGYNVYRAEGGRPPRRVNAKPFPEPAFDDRDFVFDRAYAYFIRASASDAEPFAESADSPVAVVAPKDVFPPATPAGLTTAAGAGVITLLWDASREPDLAGYKVWRREAGKTEFVALTERPIPENTYTDATAEKGRRYEYAVSALDRAGNESPRLALVSEIMKGPPIRSSPRRR